MAEQENKVRWAVTIDPDLARRVDALAEIRGDSRSAMLERLVYRAIDIEEDYVNQMENPAVRLVTEVIVKHPGVLDLVAKLVGEKITDEQIARAQRDVPLQAKRARERQRVKRAKKSKPRDGERKA